MGTRETKAQRGRRRGRELTAVVIAQLRDARLAAGLSQRAVAAAVGWSQQHYSRFETGRLSNIPLTVITVIASLLGLDASLTFHRVGPALRDKGHQALIARFTRLLSPAWRVIREAPFPNLGDPRSWDALLRLANQLVGVEAETRIRDMQALVRRMRQRATAGGADVMVLVLSDSAHNRDLFHDLRAALGPDFATPPGELLIALRNGLPLPGSGVVLL
jgi:transcriptional regulator with XRE-family HTH domain